MFDFDPRDQDRDDERWGSDHGRGSRGASDTRERDDEWLQPGHRGDLGDSRDHRWEDDSRDIRDDDWRDRDDDSRELGRGPGSDASRDSHSEEDPRNRYDDGRSPERDREPRDRDIDPRDVFMRHLDLPRRLEREIVRDRGREYTLRGSETRTLSTVGAFRVVPARDLRDYFDRPADPAVRRPPTSARAKSD